MWQVVCPTFHPSEQEPFVRYRSTFRDWYVIWRITNGRNGDAPYESQSFNMTGGLVFLPHCVNEAGVRSVYWSIPV